MTKLGEFLREEPPRVQQRNFFARPEKASELETTFPPSIHNQQIHNLVQQLFFRNGSGLVRRVGLTAVEASAQTAKLSLDVAKILVDEGRYEVGLIDAGIGGIPLRKQLQIPTPAEAQRTCAIAPRLWLAPRDSWYQEDGQDPTTNQNLERLRDLTSEFDFAIVHCPPVSWLSMRIGHVCDGLVLVLTANKTRRLVASQVKDDLSKNHVRLLGTVLAERRFPVPNGLYRSL